MIIKLDEDTQWASQDGQNVPVDSDALDNILDLHPNRWFTPEQERINLPSALAVGEIDCQSLKSITTIEAELHKGQVLDALEGLRLALGEKSLHFQTEVWNVNSQQTTQ